MKLIRFDADQGVALGLVEGDEVVNLTAGGLVYPTMLALIAGGTEALDAVRRVASGAPRIALSSVSLRAPIEKPGKYLAIGMNYQKHLEEADKLGVAALEASGLVQ